jgi:Protein of unknown function (DUF2550)
MQGWLGVVQVLGVLAALLAASILLLAGRRRWLNRLGGTFECSLRLRMRTPGAGWVLGVGRYSEGILEWFRYFSYSLRPRMVFPRRSIRVLETRMPNPVEAVALNADEKVVRLEMQDGRAETQWELAMSEESVTGLLSWLEAAPPGVRRFE